MSHLAIQQIQFLLSRSTLIGEVQPIEEVQQAKEEDARGEDCLSKREATLLWLFKTKTANFHSNVGYAMVPSRLKAERVF